jgi:arsenite methyltransferase
MRADVGRYVDRVLDAAGLHPGMVLLDVGTGDAVVAIRALDRVGPSLRLVLLDVSAPLLERARATLDGLGQSAQCAFLQRSAESIHGLDDASIDAVTARAALAYVADKAAAVREFHRVLKPNGCVSIAEPVLRDEGLNAIALRQLLESAGSAADPILRLIHRWKAAQFPDTQEKLSRSPITNYSERQLLGYFQEAGFTDLHLELHIDVCRMEGMAWDTFMDSSPHPLAPTLRTISTEQFTDDERSLFERSLRPWVESGSPNALSRVVYLHGRKP